MTIIFFFHLLLNVENCSGDYLYKKNNQGELIYDQNQKLIIDDDFEEIINDFNKFLKKEKINF